jgi:DNA-binding LacI/PurR family transcriptional regulator
VPRSVTLKEVAERAGVSISAASCALNNSRGTRVGAARRALIEQVAADLGYHPNSHAQSLVTGRSSTVAVASGHVGDQHYARMLQRTHEIAGEPNLGVLHLPTPMTVPPAQLLRERRAFVLLLTSEADVTAEVRSLMGRDQVVVVACPLWAPPPEGVLCAYWLDHEGYRLALEHIHGLGHRHVAFLGGLWGAHKHELFLAEARRLDLDGVVVTTEAEAFHESMAMGAEMMRRVLSMRPRPTAVFARNDDFAIGALHAAALAGVRVPDEISVIGNMDFPVAPFCNPALTSVDTPFVECVEHVLLAALDALADGGAASPSAGVRQVRHPPRRARELRPGPSAGRQAGGGSLAWRRVRPSRMAQPDDRAPSLRGQEVR